MILTISYSSSTNRILYGVDFLFFVVVFMFVAIAVSSSAFKISYVIIYYHIQSIAGDINFFYNWLWQTGYDNLNFITVI